MSGIRVAVAALLGASLLVALGAPLSSCGSAATNPAGTGSTVTGQAATTVTRSSSSAAPAFSGVTLDGKAVNLDQYRGKPLLLVYMTPG